MARCGKYLMNSLQIYRISFRLPNSKKACKKPTTGIIAVKKEKEGKAQSRFIKWWKQIQLQLLYARSLIYFTSCCRLSRRLITLFVFTIYALNPIIPTCSTLLKMSIVPTSSCKPTTGRSIVRDAT